MNANLPRLIDAFAGLRVLVIGEAMLDSYLEGTARGLCREAPVPIVTVGGRSNAPGGAANTAANVAALDAPVEFLSVVGDDTEGMLLRQALAARGVDDAGVLTQPGRRTLAKNRVLADGQMLVRFDQGSTDPIAPSVEEALTDRLTALYPRCDAVIVSDYGYGVVSPRLIAALTVLQARSPRVLVADAKDLSAYRHAGVTAVKPNYAEAVRLLGEREMTGGRVRLHQIAAAGGRLLDLTGARLAAITLDTEGALLFERDCPPYRTYTRPTRNARAAGAGDTFVSALTLALAAGADTTAAAEIAAAAAEIVVGRDGTAACDARDLRVFVSGEDKYVDDVQRLAERVAFSRRQGRRIVFTNGCFDILHRGHITYLNRAKALGDVLIIGINSDDSVRMLKGPTRPINTLDDRAQVLAALSCVDHIISFAEETPSDIIRAIRPDVFVKGGDYTRETLPEAPLVEELGGTVQILPYVEDRSTTRIIERIQADLTP